MLPRSLDNSFMDIIDSGSSIMGICNGIIFMKKDGDICFINPMIRYCLHLPSHEDKSIYSYGFISRGLSDYLVVKIDLDEKYCYYPNRRNDDGRNDDGPREPYLPRSAWVYTYIENDWRSLKILDCSLCTTTTIYNGVVYNGLLHWGAMKYLEKAWYYFILTFDPETEVFGELLLPDSLATALYSLDDDYQNGEFGVFVVQNSTKPLTVYSLISSEENYCTVAVWVMDRYGITESWNQIFTFNCDEDYISSTLFGFNPDIHEDLEIPFLLFHRDDGTLLFGVEFNGKYLIRSLDISHGTSTVLIDNVTRNFEDPNIDYSYPSFYIGYSPPSLVLLDNVSASGKC